MKNLDNKQPSEQYAVDFNFAGDLGSETIASYTVVVKDSNGTDVTSTMTDASENSNTDTAVSVLLRNGTDGYSYVYTVKITGSSGSVYEGDARLKVVEEDYTDL